MAEQGEGRRSEAAQLLIHGPGRESTAAPRMSRAERVSLVAYPADVERPLSRADCLGAPRPCPFVSCSHHLYLDVNPETGAIKLNFPHLEVWEMAETCSLDVADRGGITLEEIGAVLNLTRERVRQIETSGLAKALRAAKAGGLELPAERPPGVEMPG